MSWKGLLSLFGSSLGNGVGFGARNASGKAFMGGAKNGVVTSGRFNSIVGLISNFLTETSAQVLASEAMTITNLKAKISAGNSGTATLTLRKNAADVNNTIAITGTGVGEDTSHSDSFVANDPIDVSYTDTGTDSTLDFISMLVKFLTGFGCIHGPGDATTTTYTSSSVTLFIGIGGALVANSSLTITDAQWKVRGYTSIESFSVKVPQNTRTSSSTFQLNVNGTPVGTAITFGAGVTGTQIVVNQAIALAPGDLVCVQLVLGAGGLNLVVPVFGVTFKSTKKAQDIFFACSDQSSARAASATPNYYLPMGSRSLITTESARQVALGIACIASNLRIFVSVNTYTGAATLTLRVNGAASALTLTIGAGATGWFEDTTHSVILLPTDLISIELVGGTLNNLTFQALGFTVA